MIDTQLDGGYENVVMLLRQIGRNHLRPAGLEADRAGAPIPPDHPVFVTFNRLGFRFGLQGTGKGSNRSNKSKEPSRAGRTGVLAAEELAYWDQGATMSLPGPGLGGPPIALKGTKEQRERYLKGPFRDPEKPAWGAYALTEPGAGSDVARIGATAERDGSSWIINGEKMFITNGARAEWVVVFASVDPSAGRAGQRAFIVEKGTPGFSIGRVEKKMGLTASETASLVFENCRIPAENLLGGEEDGKQRSEGFKVAMATFDQTRPMVAAMSVGIGKCAWERAQEIAKDAFGRSPRSTYEVLALDRLANARRQLDAARLLCWQAAWKLDHRQENTVEASMAKVYAPRASLYAAEVAMDIAGLAGVTDELIEKSFRDVKIFDIFEGTGEVQRIVLARRLFGYPSRGRTRAPNGAAETRPKTAPAPQTEATP